MINPLDALHAKLDALVVQAKTAYRTRGEGSLENFKAAIRQLNFMTVNGRQKIALAQMEKLRDRPRIPNVVEQPNDQVRQVFVEDLTRMIAAYVDGPRDLSALERHRARRALQYLQTCLHYKADETHGRFKAAIRRVMDRPIDNAVPLEEQELPHRNLEQLYQLSPEGQTKQAIQHLTRPARGASPSPLRSGGKRRLFLSPAGSPQRPDGGAARRRGRTLLFDEDEVARAPRRAHTNALPPEFLVDAEYLNEDEAAEDGLLNQADLDEAFNEALLDDGFDEALLNLESSEESSGSKSMSQSNHGTPEGLGTPERGLPGVVTPPRPVAPELLFAMQPPSPGMSPRGKAYANILRGLQPSTPGSGSPQLDRRAQGAKREEREDDSSKSPRSEKKKPRQLSPAVQALLEAAEEERAAFGSASSAEESSTKKNRRH
jgi:hypothetical protein